MVMLNKCQLREADEIERGEKERESELGTDNSGLILVEMEVMMVVNGLGKVYSFN